MSLRKILIIILSSICIISILNVARPILEENNRYKVENEMKILIVYNAKNVEEHPNILPTYKSVLEEEGVSHAEIDVYRLVSISPEAVLSKTSALILPDYVLERIPSAFGLWLKEYVDKGGCVSVIYNPGVKYQRGTYLDKAELSDLVGINYITETTEGEDPYTNGNVVFTSSENREFFEIPYGKTVDKVSISGYHYGKLIYPIAKNEFVQEIAEKNIYAYAVAEDQKKYPAIVLNNYGKGKVLYINLPLGALKGEADDLLMRAFLRTFLFKIVEIPHVMNVKNGIGGIAINWHVDSNIEHDNFPKMIACGLIRQSLPATFHITAGDFLDEPGDEAGFNIEGEIGENLAEIMTNYGEVGSHGGWAHNYFAKKIEDDIFHEAEVREYIEKNNTAVEKVTKNKVTSYSAPDGVFPQVYNTKILEDMDISSYYYTGDTGSGLNRTFYDGKMVSEKVLAFPVMPFGKYASLGEMEKDAKLNNDDIVYWYKSILDYAVQNRTVRLFYSHPYDIGSFIDGVEKCLDMTEELKAQNKLQVDTMTNYAKFFLRFLKTQYHFKKAVDGMDIDLSNVEGIDGITVAIPKKQYQKPEGLGFSLNEDEYYYYLVMEENNENKIQIHVNYL